MIESILEAYPFPNPQKDAMKLSNRHQTFLEEIRKADEVTIPKRKRKEYVQANLVPALHETEEDYQELQEDITETFEKTNF